MKMVITKKGFLRQQGAVQTVLLIKAVLAALLLAWLASSLVQLSDSLGIFSSPSPTIEAPREPVDAAPAETSSLPPIDLNTLKSQALFGEVVATPEPVIEEPKEEVVVETKLNLTLKGLFTADIKEEGRAIIANGRDEQLYQVGQEIEGLSQVTLLEVFVDRIKLNNRGNVEVLYLYPEGERLSSGNGAVSAFVDSGPANLSDLAGASDDGETVKSKTLNQIMRVVRERDKATGEMLGFRVLPGRDRDAFTQSGLKANDVITSIDGEALTDLRSAMNIYRGKRNASEVALIVRRGEEELSIDIDLSGL